MAVTLWPQGGCYTGLMANETLETDIHDLSLGVIHALAMVNARSLSYVQLRRLYAALVHAADDVESEIARRSDSNNLGETVRFKAPPKK
jgi:hypothetical protein